MNGENNLSMNGTEVRFGDAGLALYRVRFVSWHTKHSDAKPTSHAHTCFELHAILNGSALFRIDDTEIRVSAGEILLIRPNAEHISYLSGEECENYVLDLILKKQDGTPGFYEYFSHALESASHQSFPVSTELIQAIASYEQKITNLSQDPFWAHCRTQKETLNILVSLLEEIKLAEQQRTAHQEKTALQKPREELLEDGKKILLGELVNDPWIPLVQIAEKLGYSQRHTARLIRQTFGKSLGEIREHLRLESAKRFLAQEEIFSVCEIAQASGFSEVNAMNRSFLKNEGCTAVEYRKKHWNAKRKSDASKTETPDEKSD